MKEATLKNTKPLPETESETLVRFNDDATISFWYEGYEPFCLPQNTALEGIIQKIEKEEN